MAKNQSTGGQSSGAVRDSSRASSRRFLDQKRPKGCRREILFPTEPTTIGHEKIDRAIEQVISRRK